jgi:hypothetical protein
MLKDRKITQVISQRPRLSVYSLMAAAVMLVLTPSAARADIHLKLIS